MNPEIRERLTAYLLGEATEVERAEIERLIATDPEVALERDRIEATVALVQQFGGGSAELSPERAAALERSAAEGGRPLAPVLSFYRRPVFAAAAVLLLAVSASAIYFSGPNGFGGRFAPNARPDDEVARLDRAGGSRVEYRADSPKSESAGELASHARVADGEAPTERSRGEANGEKLGESLGQSQRERGVLEGLGYVSESEARARQLFADLSVAGTETTSGNVFHLEVAKDPSLQPDQGAGKGAPTGAAHGGAYRGPGDALPPTGGVSGARTGPGGPPAPGSDSLGAKLAGGGALPPSSPAPTAATESRDGLDRSGYIAGYDTPIAPGASIDAGLRGDRGDASGDSPSELPAAEREQVKEKLERLVSLGYADGSAEVLVDKRRASGSLELSLGTEVPREVELQNESRASRRFDNDYLGLTEGKNLDVWTRNALEPWAGDWTAMLQYEQQLLREMGLEPGDSGLRKLLESMGYVAPGSTGTLDTPEILAARWRFFGRKVLEQRITSVLNDCNRRTAESVRDMFFRHWGTRPFESTSVDPMSTFAADVDTSSYTLARKMLDSGILPGSDQIRVEEWINYFDAELPKPQGQTFAVETRLVPSPFDGDNLGEPTMVLRVGIQGREVEEYQRTGLHLTFVVDTSGSMGQDNRIELVRNALRQLLTKLDARDQLAIVAFNNSAWTVLEPTSATDRARIEAAITSLGSNGGTNVESGLMSGFALASNGYDSEVENRVVLLSDGVGNIGEVDQNRLLEKVAQFRTNRIYLNTIGVGLANHNDVFLEQLANRGEGVSNYVDTPLEARRAFVENFTGAFQTIARDVKIQVEFDPARVKSYRLIGYENRAVADRAFRDDQVDGGEIGAGHSVVALYELRGVDLGASSGVTSSESSTEASPDHAIATVRLRWKPPGGGAPNDAATEIEHRAGIADVIWDFATAPVGLRKNVLVAEAAEMLRRSAHVRGDSLDVLDREIQRAANESGEEEFRAFAGLFARHRTAIGALVRPASPVESKLDALKFVRYELELERTTKGAPDAEKVAQYEQRIAELEAEVRAIAFGDVAQRDPVTAPVGSGDDR